MSKPMIIEIRTVGPHVACTLLGLWAEGKVELTLEDFRALNKRLALFLEELEEVRENVFMSRE